MKNRLYRKTVGVHTTQEHWQSVLKQNTHHRYLVKPQDNSISSKAKKSINTMAIRAFSLTMIWILYVRMTVGRIVLLSVIWCKTALEGDGNFQYYIWMGVAPMTRS